MMTLSDWRCAHGLGWSDKCIHCDVERAREIVNRWGKYVDESRMVIEEFEKEGEEA